MRIISGAKARHTLLSPMNKATRPITDRVKESLFSILEPRLADANVVDLFCGTGSLGLESLSRGARHAVLVDRDRENLKRLKTNIDRLGFARQATVVRANIFSTGIPEASLPSPAMSSAKNWPVNLVFVDPPYKESDDGSLTSRFGRLMILLGEQMPSGALAIARHDRRATLEAIYGRLAIQDVRRYGSMSITFLENHE